LVGLTAPTHLVATAVSTSQINLSWTGVSGATGYLIQETLNSGGGWTQIGSTSGSTVFQQTGLAAGMTYYYRVVATVGSYESGYSNVASATTGTPTTSGDTIWSNSYIPSENASDSGSYEVGVQFISSQPGKVTGVRFYKETGMGGYVHVGHLWSSTGQLLATATFTNETASGWQQVSFSAPVQIQSYTVYIASFSTGGGSFGITTGFFNSAGVTNGPLQALANGAPGGNGVYNTADNFPSVDGNGMNFWADVAFTPSYGGVITRVATRTTESTTGGGFGTNVLAPGQATRLFDWAPPSTPAGPVRFAAGGTIPTPTVPSSWSNRGPVLQAAATEPLFLSALSDFLPPKEKS
jgi:hypothetical protein